MNLKKLLCLLLALAMVFTLAACSDSGSDKDEDEDDEEIVEEEDEDKKDDEDEDKQDDEDEDKQDDEDEDKKDEDEDKEEDPSDAIIGSWVGYIYMTEDNTGLVDFVSHAGLPIVFTFNADGTVSMAAYEPEIEDAMATLEDDLVDYMMQTLYEEGYYQDMDTEEVDAFIMDQTGMTVEEYCRAYIDEMGLLESFMEIEDSTTYSIEDGLLNLDGELLNFEVKGDTLVVYDSTNPEYWEELGMEFPVELKRAD